MVGLQKPVAEACMLDPVNCSEQCALALMALACSFESLCSLSTGFRPYPMESRVCTYSRALLRVLHFQNRTDPSRLPETAPGGRALYASLEPRANNAQKSMETIEEDRKTRHHWQRRCSSIRVHQKSRGGSQRTLRTPTLRARRSDRPVV
jgi:hypothetical protein